LILTSSIFELSSCGNNDDGDGADNKPDARCTRSSRMLDTHSISDNHNNSPGIQSRLPRFPEFRRKSERQSAAREQKRIQLRPMQLKEAFSWLSFCLFPFLICCFNETNARVALAR
jgi:hypothetical protein